MTSPVSALTARTQASTQSAKKTPAPDSERLVHSEQPAWLRPPMSHPKHVARLRRQGRDTPIIPKDHQGRTCEGQVARPRTTCISVLPQSHVRLPVGQYPPRVYVQLGDALRRRTEDAPLTSGHKVSHRSQWDAPEDLPISRPESRKSSPMTALRIVIALCNRHQQDALHLYGLCSGRIVPEQIGVGVAQPSLPQHLPGRPRRTL